MTRSDIVAAARSWLGTPYQHQASLKGVGCDCLGLVRGVWRALYGAEPEAAPPYRADWAETGAAETLLDAAGRHLTPIPIDTFQPGDVLLFRMSAGACVKHAAVVSAGEPGAKIIHAYWGRACVESWLGPWWRRRLAFAFSFPGVEPPDCPRPRARPSADPRIGSGGDPGGASAAADSAGVPALAGMNGI